LTLSFFEELKRRNVFRVGIVYVVIGWVLIQVADVMAPQLNLPEWTPRMITFLVLLGFPVSLVMAWALELTPEGVKKAGGSNAPIYVFAIALVAASMYWFFEQRAKTPAQAPVAVVPVETAIEPDESAGPPSIAVIPFANMSMDVTNEPFTVGIHDDLLTQLSKIHSLKTISRTSVLRYKDSDKSIPEIAGELGVTSILEGGVQRIGDSVRINVQLIDAATDEHLWAETYDRELSAASIFAIQSEIAAAIAGALEATLTSDDQQRLAKVPTENLAALDAYFLGKQFADKRTEEDILEAIDQFELAIGLDPEFALAHAGRAYAWLLIPEYSPSIDRDLAFGNSEDSAARALELDPSLPEGLWVSGWNRMAHYYDWTGAERLLRQALVEHPTNPEALHWLSHVLSWQGKHDEAVRVAELTVKSDPLSPLMRSNLSYIVGEAGDYQRAIDIRDEALGLQNVSSELYRNTYLTQIRAGRYKEATQSLLDWAKGTGRDLNAAAQLGRALELHGETGEIGIIPSDVLKTLRISANNSGEIYAAAGDREMALSELEKGLNERSASRSVLSMKINPLYDFMRDDPRFMQLMKEANFLP